MWALALAVLCVLARGFCTSLHSLQARRRGTRAAKLATTQSCACYSLVSYKTLAGVSQAFVSPQRSLSRRAKTSPRHQGFRWSSSAQPETR